MQTFDMMFKGPSGELADTVWKKVALYSDVEKMQEELSGLIESKDATLLEQSVLISKMQEGHLSEQHQYMSILEAQREEHRREIAEIKAHTWCAYCGYEIHIDDKAATKISEHIMTCECHPMRILEKQIDTKDKEIEEVRTILLHGLDRKLDVGDSLRVLVTVAVNGIYWRDKEIAILTAQLSDEQRDHDLCEKKNWDGYCAVMTEKDKEIATLKVAIKEMNVDITSWMEKGLALGDERVKLKEEITALTAEIERLRIKLDEMSRGISSRNYMRHAPYVSHEALKEVKDEPT